MLSGLSLSESPWFEFIKDELDDDDDDDKEVFSPEGERRPGTEQLTLLVRQTKIIDTARRGRYMFK
jgi:predicted RNA binding protein with dsRBD fold (UPF0201 family)